MAGYAGSQPIVAALTRSPAAAAHRDRCARSSDAIRLAITGAHEADLTGCWVDEPSRSVQAIALRACATTC